MTDPKEAAILRLADAFQRGDKVANYPGDPYVNLARIAIEQGVVPAVKADRAGMILPAEIRKDLKRWDHVFPWDAVCPAAAEGEK